MLRPDRPEGGAEGSSLQEDMKNVLLSSAVMEEVFRSFTLLLLEALLINNQLDVSINCF